MHMLILSLSFSLMRINGSSFAMSDGHVLAIKRIKLNWILLAYEWTIYSGCHDLEITTTKSGRDECGEYQQDASCLKWDGKRRARQYFLYFKYCMRIDTCFDTFDLLLLFSCSAAQISRQKYFKKKSAKRKIQMDSVKAYGATECYCFWTVFFSRNTY